MERVDYVPSCRLDKIIPWYAYKDFGHSFLKANTFYYDDSSCDDAMISDLNEYLDLPHAEKTLIMGNIGNCFLLLGKYKNAKKYYESMALDCSVGNYLSCQDNDGNLPTALIKSDIDLFIEKGILELSNLNKFKKLYPELSNKIGL